MTQRTPSERTIPDKNRAPRELLFPRFYIRISTQLERIDNNKSGESREDFAAAAAAQIGSDSSWLSGEIEREREKKTGSREWSAVKKGIILIVRQSGFFIVLE